MARTIRVGLLGFGLAGRVFHAPLVTATDGLELAAIATSRVEEVKAAYPSAQVTTAEAVLTDPDIDLVVIATPNALHAPQARAALEAGKAVVIDKPFAVRSAEAQALVDLAEARGLLLSVFHNRRWDDDFLTVRGMIESGALGRIATFESRFDRFRPVVQDRWREKGVEGGGLLWDLGPHLIDQVLVLFGPPRGITADIAIQRRGGEATDYFHLQLDYDDGLRAILSAGSLVADPGPRFSVQGDAGAVVSFGLDGQESLLRAGASLSSLERRSVRHSANFDGGVRTETLPMQLGAWSAYYAGVRDALGEEGEPPVQPQEAMRVIKVIEIAEESSCSGRRVAWP